MVSVEEYRAILKEAARALGFDAVEPNEDGVCVLGFDEDYVGLRFFAHSGMLQLHTYVCALPEDTPREVYAMLLESQLFFHGTHGATISISSLRRSVLAHMILYVQALDAEKLVNAIENLLETAQRTKQQVEAGVAKELSSSQSDPSINPAFDSMMRV